MNALFTLALAFNVHAAPAQSGNQSPIKSQIDFKPECRAQIVAKTIADENAYLQSRGEKLAAPLVGSAGYSYWPQRGDGQISVRLSENKEGRYIVYRNKISKEDLNACQLPTLKRDDSTECRYSTYEGAEGLGSIKNFKFTEGPRIKPETLLTALQDAQIRIVLSAIDEDHAATKDLIASTDDGELTTATVKKPDGSVLEYYGAYGGDNPYGTFFKAGTTTVAGVNSDDSVCLPN